MRSQVLGLNNCPAEKEQGRTGRRLLSAKNEAIVNAKGVERVTGPSNGGSEVGEIFKGLVDRAPDIIGKAAESSLGVASLIVWLGDKDSNQD